MSEHVPLPGMSRGVDDVTRDAISRALSDARIVPGGTILVPRPTDPRPLVLDFRIAGAIGVGEWFVAISSDGDVYVAGEVRP